MIKKKLLASEKNNAFWRNETRSQKNYSTIKWFKILENNNFLILNTNDRNFSELPKRNWTRNQKSNPELKKNSVGNRKSILPFLVLFLG